MRRETRVARIVLAFFAVTVLGSAQTSPSETASFKDNGEGAHSLAFSPDGKTLAVGSSAPSRVRDGLPEGIIKFWDVMSGKLQSTLWQSGRRQKAGGDAYNHVRSLLFSPDGKILAAGDDVGYVLWEVQSGKEVAAFEQGFAYSGMAFSSDGKVFATVSRRVTDQPGVRLWDVATGQEKTWVKTGYVDCLDLSPDGKLLAVAKTHIALWDLSTQTQLAKDEITYPLNVVRFTADGKQLVAAGEGGRLEVYNVIVRDNKTTFERRLTTTRFLGSTYSMSFSRDGKWLATGGDANAEVWDATGWKLHLSRKGSYPALSPDGKLLAVGDPRMNQGVVRQYGYRRGEVKVFSLDKMLEQK